MLSMHTKVRIANGNPATTKLEKEWQTYMKNMMKEEGIDSLKDLSQQEKSDFFNRVDEGWNSKDEPGEDGAIEATIRKYSKWVQNG